MRPSVFAILVVAVTTAYFVSPNDAQPTCELGPQTKQRICQGSTVSFNCRTDGTSVVLSIPKIDPNQIYDVFSSDSIQQCTATRNLAIIARLLQEDASSLTGTLLFYAQPNQPADNYTVMCTCTASGNSVSTTSFRVDEAINGTIQLRDHFKEYSETFTSISWPSSDNVILYKVTINGNSYFTSRNSLFVNLPVGNHSAFIEAENSCGSYNYTDIFMIFVFGNDSNRPIDPGSTTSVTPTATSNCPPDPPCGFLCILLIVLAVICGVLIIALSIALGCIYHLRKESKKTAIVRNVQDISEKNEL